MPDFVRRLIGFEYKLLHPSVDREDSGDVRGRPASPWSSYKPSPRHELSHPIASIPTITDPRDGLRVWGTSSVSIDIDGSSIIAGRSAAAGVTCLLTGLVRKYDGKLESIGPEGKGFYFTLRGDRTIANQIFDFPLPQGELLAVNVSQPTLAQNIYTTVRGQVWISVQRTRLLPDNTLVPVQTLIANYVSTNEPCSWPGMPLTNPRDGIGYYRRVTHPGTFNFPLQIFGLAAPVGAEWEVLDLQLQITTSAAAGFRTIFVQYGLGGSPFLTTGLTIPAGTAAAVMFLAPSLASASDTLGFNTQAIVPGYRMMTPVAGTQGPGGLNVSAVFFGIGNMQAGDSATNFQLDVVERLTADA